MISHLRIVPLDVSEANALVKELHQHHFPVVGHRFSVGVINADRNLAGAAIVGRPVARLTGSPRTVLEVTRLVTDGTPNACSILYAAAARAGKAMSYQRIQTYILGEEPGTSLKAAGWVNEGAAGGHPWHHYEAKPRRTDQPMVTKQRWSLTLNEGNDYQRAQCGATEPMRLLL